MASMRWAVLTASSVSSSVAVIATNHASLQKYARRAWRRPTHAGPCLPLQVLEYLVALGGGPLAHGAALALTAEHPPHDPQQRDLDDDEGADDPGREGVAAHHPAEHQAHHAAEGQKHQGGREHDHDEGSPQFAVAVGEDQGHG